MVSRNAFYVVSFSQCVVLRIGEGNSFKGDISAGLSRQAR